MPAPSLTLAFDAAFALATSLLYAFVGELTRRRPVAEPAPRRALLLFSVWWYGLALITALGALQSALGAVGVLDLDVHVALTYVMILPLVALLWGLVYYLVYVHTGNERWFWPITWFHAALLLFLMYFFAWVRPAGVAVTDWSVTTTGARTAPPPVAALLGILILGPVLFAALAYGTLLFRARDATTRYRVGLVSGAFVLWFGSGGLAALTGLSGWYWWPLVSRVIGVVSTLLVLSAYRPPRSIRERLGVEPLAWRPTRPRAPPGSLLPIAIKLRSRV